MKLIEFTGVPGSGKTFLCGILAKKLRDRGLSVSTPLEGLAETGAARRIAFKLPRVSLFAITHARSFLEAYYTITGIGQSSFLDAVRSLVTVLLVLSVIEEHKNKAGLLLLDQGIAQSLFTFFYASTADGGELPLGSLPVPDYLIEVDAGDNEIRERLEGRAGRQSRMERDESGGIARARLAMRRMRETGLYASIPRKSTIRNDAHRDGGALDADLDSIVERILHAE